MKFKMICLAAVAAGAITPVAAWAQSTVTVYGRVDTSFENSKTGALSQTLITGNASRFGFKGSEDLGEGLRAFFGIETGFSSDTGASSTPMYRNSFVGLGGSFGVVNIGRIDSAAPSRTPIYAILGRNVEYVIHDAGATAIGTSIFNARTRVSNAVGYASPVIGNFVFRAGHYLNGEGRAEAPAGPIRFESDYKQTDVSLSYGEGGGPLGLGVGYGTDSKRGGAALNEFKNKWMLVGSYDFGAIRAWAVYNRDNFQGNALSRSKVGAQMIGASWEVTPKSKVMGNYIRKDVQSDPAARLKRLQAGYAYKMSNRTSLYAFYDRQDPNSRVANDVIRVYGVGIQHNF
ncbi:porin [Polaromonas aquatica]|uniref:porin n=1 Tax=Polaromonas aquatica TaxID=332657 RepID=UPI003D65C707